jgi:hypothetical protein
LTLPEQTVDFPYPLGRIGMGGRPEEQLDDLNGGVQPVCIFVHARHEGIGFLFQFRDSFRVFHGNYILDSTKRISGL